MIDKALSDELVSFFERYLAFYQSFLQLEIKKRNDIRNNNLNLLAEHVKSEEAYMLQSKGLEIERDQLLAKAGQPHTTFRNLISSIQIPEQEKLQNIYVSLSQVLFNLKEINNLCNNMINLRLHRIETDLEKIERHPELKQQYDVHAHKNKESTSILSKKV